MLTLGNLRIGPASLWGLLRTGYVSIRWGSLWAHIPLSSTDLFDLPPKPGGQSCPVQVSLTRLSTSLPPTNVKGQTLSQTLS